MILGIGTDIVECGRVQKIYEKHAFHFLKNILTPAELELLDRKKAKAEFIAGRWAAKEAVSKAIGTGMCEACAFVEIEILPDSHGKPVVSFHADTAKTVDRMGVRKVHLSISHEKNYATAMVILED